MAIPNLKSAKKRVRQNQTRYERNQTRRRALRRAVKRFRKAEMAGDKAEAEAAIPEVVKAADKAAQRNVIHPNKAARIKSRLMRRLNALT